MANQFSNCQLSEPRKSVVDILNAVSRYKLTQQSGNLTSISLNSISGNKRETRGTSLDLYQDHPEKKFV